MKKNSGLFAALVLGFACLFAFTGCNYNSLVELREEVESQWSNVESQYQRRMDLVPNLVSTVKAYAAHETEVYDSIAEARSKLGTTIAVDSSITDDPEKFKEFQQAQNQLGNSLSRLLSITENYPTLASNENFCTLQSQLEGTENRIATERKRYNDVAKKYNAEIKKFPALIYAKKMGFEEKAYFTADTAAAQAPKVEF